MIVQFRLNRHKFLRPYVWTIARIFCFDMLVAVGYVYFGWTWLSTPHIPIGILGGAISVLIGFRNASCYQRWSEARTIWGAILNSSRTLGRQVVTLTEDGGNQGSDVKLATVQRRILYRQMAYVNALRRQLRGQSPWDDLAAFLPADEVRVLRGKAQVAIEIHKWISLDLADCCRRGWIDSVRWAAIDGTLATLINAQGAAEGIKNTPLPRQYDLLPHMFTLIYCLLLPLSIVENLKLLTPVGSSLIAVVLLAWDQTGSMLESPFENEENDIAMTAICRTTEISLRQLLGESELPEPLKPVDGVLW